jgi:hypothetical protein
MALWRLFARGVTADAAAGGEPDKTSNDAGEETTVSGFCGVLEEFGGTLAELELDACEAMDGMDELGCTA